MTIHHAPDCMFTMSFGDQPCDCAGPAEEPAGGENDGGDERST